jgi:predicted AAA+ superfamily ATPase
MFERQLSGTLLKAIATFPAVLLTGPRQSGKTTLLRHLFPAYRYISLESPDILLHLQSDPRGFLSGKAEGWIIDEAQHWPPLFSYLQEFIDEGAQRFILSGSQNFLLNEKISQTLAGRVAVLELLPLSYAEYVTHPERQIHTLWDFLYYGSYPRPYHEHLDPVIWYNSYIRTYLERDVRSLIQVRDLSLFQLFLKLCAGRHGQLLNLNSLANDCGISQTTATQWLSILEASYIIYLLKPYHQNFNKRLVKTPKLYFYDSALVCHLLGIESPSHLQSHTQRGAMFEGFVLTEIMKRYTASGQTAPLYFWRDHVGVEVDGLLEKGEALCAIEIKSASTFSTSLLSELKKWQKIAGSKAKQTFLVYTGSSSFVFEGVSVVRWDQCDEIN